MSRKKLMLFLLLLLTLPAAGFEGIPLRSGQKIFASGMNLAWIRFGRDLIDFDEARFTLALDEIAAAGGNTVRWWLHVNGSASPAFADGVVSGLQPQEIPNLLRALDLAYERGLMLLPVLWSFDMLQKQQGVDLGRNRRLLEDRICTQAYIEHALIPMVKAAAGHPALLAWEICNEPEGMTPQHGWSAERVSIRTVQQFHNLLAGAVHRADPLALVTTGCWNVQVVSGRPEFENWYSDAALIAAGGDSLGVLDFYQVHYYPRWYNEAYSPFHHPAAYWQLDKPVLIGEFPAKGLAGKDQGGRLAAYFSPADAYRVAFENGYLGCLAWTWTGHDGLGGLKDAAPGMQLLRQIAPQAVVLQKP
ncbi:MAG: cellulase family glycosylhydrolase [candidate division KSB1 bacterium]|nr:cellulase family glycosylhydrolase [candidate division KSB1 bacterium]